MASGTKNVFWLFLVFSLMFEFSFTHGPPLSDSKKQNIEVNKGGNQHETSNQSKLQEPIEIWRNTVTAVLAISFAPLVMLYIIPDLNKRRGLLKMLLGFAAGGLLGDAFFHLIPHAIMSEEGDNHGHGHGHSHGGNPFEEPHMRAGLCVVAGVVTFLIIEKMIRLIKDDGDSGHMHSHAISNTAGDNDKKKKNDKENNQQKKKKHSAKGKSIKVAGYLNLAADFTHNFTDGLAIGASFLVSRAVGISTTMTVLIHELPHEIGDYAILIQSGCSPFKAMLLQLTTAIGAMLGAALSLLAAGVGAELIGSPEFTKLVAKLALSPKAVSTVVLPFTAGGFLYIALTSVLPDLLANHASDESETQSTTEDGELSSGKGSVKDKHQKKGNKDKKASVASVLCQTLGELVFLCLGVGLTVAVELLH